MQISEIVTANRTLLTPITPCSGLHYLAFLFPALPFATYSINSYWLSTSWHFSSLESSTLSIVRLCHCWSQLPSFWWINCLQHVQTGVSAASTNPISSRWDSMPPHASFSHTPSGSQWPRSHYLSQKLRRSLRRKETHPMHHIWWEVKGHQLWLQEKVSDPETQAKSARKAAEWF